VRLERRSAGPIPACGVEQAVHLLAGEEVRHKRGRLSDGRRGQGHSVVACRGEGCFGHGRLLAIGNELLKSLDVLTLTLRYTAKWETFLYVDVDGTNVEGISVTVNGLDSGGFVPVLSMRPHCVPSWRTAVHRILAFRFLAIVVQPFSE
jgi:hypothetical protein